MRNRQKGSPDIEPSTEGSQLFALTGIVRSLQLDIVELRRWHNKAAIKEVVEEVYGEDVMRLEKLRDDAVKALKLLVEKGAITREELNEALK